MMRMTIYYDNKIILLASSKEYQKMLNDVREDDEISEKFKEFLNKFKEYDIVIISLAISKIFKEIVKTLLENSEDDIIRRKIICDALHLIALFNFITLQKSGVNEQSIRNMIPTAIDEIKNNFEENRELIRNILEDAEIKFYDVIELAIAKALPNVALIKTIYNSIKNEPMETVKAISLISSTAIEILKEITKLTVEEIVQIYENE